MSTYSALILGESSLVSYWRLDDASGAFVDAKSGFNGTAAGTVTRGVAGLITGDSDTAVSTAGGTSNQITIPHASANAMPLTTAMSFEAWIKLVALDATLSCSIMNCKGFQPRFQLAYNVNGTFEWDVYGASNVRNFFTTANAAGSIAVAGQVQHLVGTYDSVAAQMKLYLNGVDISQALSSGSANVAIYGGDNSADMNFLYGGAGHAVNGTVDEIAIYNTALTPTQVISHYLTGIASPLLLVPVARSVSAGVAGAAAPQIFSASAAAVAAANVINFFAPTPTSLGSPIAASASAAVAAVAYPVAVIPVAARAFSQATANMTTGRTTAIYVGSAVDFNRPPPGFIRALSGINHTEWTYDWKTGKIYYDPVAQTTLGLPVPLFNVLPDGGFEADPIALMPPTWAIIDNGTTRMSGQVGNAWSASGANSLHSASQFSGAASGSNAGMNIALANLAEALPGQFWSARCVVNIYNLPSPTTGLQLGARFYDVTQTFISATYATGVNVTGVATLSLQGAIAPPGAAYVQFTVRAFVTSTGSGVLMFDLDECVLVNARSLPPNVYFEGSSPLPATMCIDGYGALRFFKGDLRPGQTVPDPDIP